MKKIIIAAALILTSAVTAFSLSRAENHAEQTKIKTETAGFTNKGSAMPKSDIATAD